MHLRSLAVLGAIGIIAACADQTAPRSSAATPTTEYAIQPMSCTVQVQTKSVSCAPATAGGQPLANRLRKDLIVGGQHTYVTLTSSNIFSDPNFDPGLGLFEFNVTLTNLTPQPFGTSDGTTADTAGIKVFLTSQPVTTGGTGAVTVENPSGTGTFTNTNQPFYQYSSYISGGILDSGQTTNALTWIFFYDNTVTDFSFTAYVATPVPHPNGYIKGMPRELWVEPNGTATLTPTVYSAVGSVITGDTLVYQSFYPGVVSVTSDGTLTAGATDTATDITVADTSGARIGLDTSLVVVCQITPVSNGEFVHDTLFANDCSHPIDNAQNFSGYRAKVYRVSLNAGQVLTASTDVSQGSLDSYMVLSDSVGNLLTSNDDAVGFGVGSQITYTATVAGTYYIQVSSQFPSGTGPSDGYILSVTVAN